MAYWRRAVKKIKLASGSLCFKSSRRKKFYQNVKARWMLPFKTVTKNFIIGSDLLYHSNSNGCHEYNILCWQLDFIISETTLWVKKKQDTILLSVTSPNVNRFSNFFTDRLTRKCVTNSYLNKPPHPKRVAALLCEISQRSESRDA